METDNKLRQAIKTYIDTFHEVKRLVELITELPIMQEVGLLRYGNNRVLQSWRLTTKDIESLYHRLTHSTLVEDINNGIVEGFPDDKTISLRIKHLNFSRNQADDSKIEDIDLAFGDNIPTTKILSEIMDYAEAYDYINTVWGIFREWNLIVDCLNKVVSEIESEFLTPQSDTSTEQEQTVKRSPIMENTELIEIINESVKRGYAEKTKGGYYRWLRDNPLLAYFVQQLSEYLDLSEKLYEKEDGEIESTNWSYFGGIFETKRRGGKWELADGDKLHDYKRGAMKGKDRKKKYQPKGFEDIDDLMLDFR